MEILRNITRRKLRSFLTITGIVIGVLALTTMGSMSENFNADRRWRAVLRSEHVGPPDGRPPIRVLEDRRDQARSQASRPRSGYFFLKARHRQRRQLWPPDAIIAGDPPRTTGAS
jgi:hypothetical protein